MTKAKGPSRIGDAIRSWLVCLVPRIVCAWLWHNEWMPLGHWAPHILGRKLGSDAKRADSLNQHNERKESEA